MFMIEPYYFEYDFVLQMSLYFLDRKVSRGITFILAIIWQAKNDSSASSTLGIPTNFLPDKSGFCTEWFCSRSADWAPFPCCASMTSTGSIQPWKTEYIFGCLASLKTSSSLSLPLTPSLTYSLTSSLLQWSVAALLMNICQPLQLYVTLWLWFFSLLPPPSPNTIFTSKSFGSFKTFVRVLVMRRAKVLFMQKVYRVQSMIRRWRALAEFSTGCSIIHVNPAD